MNLHSRNPFMLQKSWMEWWIGWITLWRANEGSSRTRLAENESNMIFLSKFEYRIDNGLMKKWVFKNLLYYVYQCGNCQIKFILISIGVILNNFNFQEMISTFEK